MKQLLVLVLAGFLVTDVSSDNADPLSKCECGLIADGTVEEITEGVKSGDEVNPQNKYPWVVALLEKVTTEEETQMTKFCGGTLVSENLVLTSASCMQKTDCKAEDGAEDACNRDSSEVFVGFIKENGLDSDGQPVEKIILQRVYKGTGSLIGDVALLKLSNPISCTASSRPVCLGKRSMFKVGTAGVITGWGTKSVEEGKVVDVLINGKLKIADRRKCWKIKDFKKAKEAVMCSSDTDRESYCKNAAGSVFVVPKDKKFLALGVLPKTIADECERSEFLPLASIEKYTRWIKKNIKNETPS